MYDVVFVMTTHPTHSYYKCKLKPAIQIDHDSLYHLFCEFYELSKAVNDLFSSSGQTMRSLISCLFTGIFLIHAFVVARIAQASLNQA